MSKSGEGPKLVTALYPFKGKNNDELCFKKGDVITLTQVDDGGWWEGTLNDKTGWFPANYVKEFKSQSAASLQSFSLSDTDSASTASKLSPEKSSPDSPTQSKINRDIVLKDIVESERTNVAELQGLVNSYLQPLEASNLLTKDECKQLIGNFGEILEVHQCLLNSLENAILQGADSRVGNIFLTLAPRLKSVHMTYCTGHPQAVCILDRYRDELNDLMEQNGAITPGILVLTTGLSKPFRRLEKYYSMLHELERHTEKFHPDRGDTQRSASVYRDISDRCAAIRKERELALLVLSGGIKGWEGEELSSLGGVLHIGPVILISGNERRDRYFVLFSSTLLVLSTSIRMSSFVYEGKLPLTGIRVQPLESTEEAKHIFEISGPMIENISVICPSRDDKQQWIELLRQDTFSSLSHVHSPTSSLSSSHHFHHTSNHSFKIQTVGTGSPMSPEFKNRWTLASLRPAPPFYVLRPLSRQDLMEGIVRTPTKAINEQQFQDDASILRVIEGYCMTTNARLTMNSAVMDSHKVHDSNMISIMNNNVGNWDELDTRKLSEVVKGLKDDMSLLRTQVSHLFHQLEEEKKSRVSLTATVKRSMSIIDGTVP